MKRALVDPKKNKFRMRSRLASFALKEILEALFLLPNPRNKRNVRQKMPCDHDAGTDRADCRDDEVAISGEPMHAAILRAAQGAANAIL